MLKKLFKRHDGVKHQEFYNPAGVTKEQFDAHWMPFSGNRILASNGYLQTQMSEVLMQKKYVGVFF